jgi:large subunit ribosomal protein L21
MYAVIKTGGKQYRVEAGDVLVVEKLAGEPGAQVAFDQVLMLGDGAGVTVGAPVVDGAVVSATLVEPRKGVTIKVFKKIRRQGYRRTGGHRQIESVVRVTAIAGDGKSESWDGEVDLTPRSVLNARARGLAPRLDIVPVTAEEDEALALDATQDAVEAPAKKRATPKAKAAGGEAALAKKPAAKKAKPAAGEDA